MIERLIGIIVGGIVTFVLLLLFRDGRIISNETTGFLVAVAIGAATNLLWPVIATLSSAQRAKKRRDETVQVEVQRQLASHQKPSDEVQ